MKNKELILDTVKDLVSDFLFYDRKEDEDLKLGQIEKSIAKGIITKEEIVEFFKDELYKNLL